MAACAGQRALAAPSAERMAALDGRRKGLVSSSAPSRLGTVALPWMPPQADRRGRVPHEQRSDKAPARRRSRRASSRLAQQPCARQSTARRPVASALCALAQTLSATAEPGPRCLHTKKSRARRAPRLRPQLLDLRRARGEHGVVRVDLRGELGVALRVLVAAEDPRAGRKLAQLGQRLPPAPRACQAPPTQHHAGVGFTVFGRRQPWAAQPGPRPPAGAAPLLDNACMPARLHQPHSASCL